MASWHTEIGAGLSQEFANGAIHRKWPLALDSLAKGPTDAC